MSLQHAILGVLEARPMTGYELVQFFDSSMTWVWSAPQSQIYPRLRAMDEEGLIAGQKEIRGERLERTVYSITDDGLAELRRWVVSDEESPPPRDPLLLRAVFFDMVDAEHAIAILQKSIEEQESLIERWTEHRDLLAAKATPLLRERLRRRPAADHDRVAQLKAHVFDGKIAVAQARVQWAREGIEILRGKTRRGGAPYARASA